jgi:hypothetical protein
VFVKHQSRLSFYDILKFAKWHFIILLWALMALVLTTWTCKKYILKRFLSLIFTENLTLKFFLLFHILRILALMVSAFFIIFWNRLCLTIVNCTVETVKLSAGVIHFYNVETYHSSACFHHVLQTSVASSFFPVKEFIKHLLLVLNLFYFIIIKS